MMQSQNIFGLSVPLARPSSSLQYLHTPEAWQLSQILHLPSPPLPPSPTWRVLAMKTWWGISPGSAPWLTPWLSGWPSGWTPVLASQELILILACVPWQDSYLLVTCLMAVNGDAVVRGGWIYYCILHIHSSHWSERPQILYHSCLTGYN